VSWVMAGRAHEIALHIWPPLATEIEGGVGVGAAGNRGPSYERWDACLALSFFSISCIHTYMTMYTKRRAVAQLLLCI
jgi:hypothetical protein